MGVDVPLESDRFSIYLSPIVIPLHPRPSGVLHGLPRHDCAGLDAVAKLAGQACAAAARRGTWGGQVGACMQGSGKAGGEEPPVHPCFFSLKPPVQGLHGIRWSSPPPPLIADRSMGVCGWGGRPCSTCSDGDLRPSSGRFEPDRAINANPHRQRLAGRGIYITIAAGHPQIDCHAVAT